MTAQEGIIVTTVPRQYRTRLDRSSTSDGDGIYYFEHICPASTMQHPPWTSISPVSIRRLWRHMDFLDWPLTNLHRGILRLGETVPKLPPLPRNHHAPAISSSGSSATCLCR